MGAASALAAGLVAGACGDDSGGKTTTATGSAGASASPAAASASASATPVTGGTFTDAEITASFLSQDPHSTPSGVDITPRVYNYLFRSAGQQAPDIAKVPDLAERQELAPDNVTIIFHLRNNVKIAPNDKGVTERVLDSDDCVKNWQRIGDPKTGANLLGFYNEHIDSFDAPDQFTFRMKLKSPYAFYLDEINLHAGGSVAPKEILANQDLKTAPVGGGPFRQTELVQGSHGTLERNANYYKQGLPYLDKWIYRLFTDVVTSRTAFQGGQIDRYAAQNIDEANEIKGQKKDVQLLSYAGAGYTGFWMNVRRDPWKDERVRQAVALATNRKEYITLVGHNQGVPCGPLTRSFSKYVLPDAELAQLQPFDVKKASDLFKTAGVSQFNLQYEGPLVDYVNIFVRQMQAAGVTVKATPQDIGTWVPNFYVNDLDCTFFGHNLYDTPDLALAWFKTHGVIGADKYDTGYSNAEVDSAIAKAAATLDEQQRSAAYQDAVRTILKSSPAMVNIFTAFGNVMLAKDVHNIIAAAGTPGNTNPDMVWRG